MDRYTTGIDCSQLSTAFRKRNAIEIEFEIKALSQCCSVGRFSCCCCCANVNAKCWQKTLNGVGGSSAYPKAAHLPLPKPSPLASHRKSVLVAAMSTWSLMNSETLKDSAGQQPCSTFQWDYCGHCCVCVFFGCALQAVVEWEVEGRHWDLRVLHIVVLSCMPVESSKQCEDLPWPKYRRNAVRQFIKWSC